MRNLKHRKRSLAEAMRGAGGWGGEAGGVGDGGGHSS